MSSNAFLELMRISLASYSIIPRSFKESSVAMKVALLACEGDVGATGLGQRDYPECDTLFEAACRDGKDAVDGFLCIARQNIQEIEKEYFIGVENLGIIGF